ncbi:MAG: hypothetical protein ACO1N9_14000 [Flavobacterium sp.]
MNAISEIIVLMSKNDKLKFKGYLSERATRSDTKLPALFKLLETDDINGSKKIATAKENAAAYHALRKRLYDNLVDFMANRTFEAGASAESEAMKLVTVCRYFFEHKLAATAFKCLAKAERIADGAENFGLLNDVYQLRLQYAHLDPAENVHKLVEKARKNSHRLHHEERMNMAYALLRNELTQIYHKGKIVDFQQVITATIKSLGISLDDALTFKSLYQLLFIANEFASIRNDYSSILHFAEKSYAHISQKKAQGGRQLYYHIYLMYFLANAALRNGNFTAAKQHLEEMNDLMDNESGKYRQRFAARYCLLLALTENYSGNPNAAVAIIRKSLKENTKAEPTDVNDLRLSLVMILVQMKDKAAIKTMLEFPHTDAWYEKRMGMDWAIKKALVGILAYAEFEHTETALTRIKAFRKRYKKYLHEVSEVRVLDYLAVVEKFLNKPELAKIKLFRDEIHDWISKQGKGTQPDIFVKSSLDWLVQKIR